MEATYTNEKEDEKIKTKKWMLENRRLRIRDTNGNKNLDEQWIKRKNQNKAKQKTNKIKCFPKMRRLK